jgi:hypothetical protein
VSNYQDFSSCEEVREMKCAWCGERIEDKPIWKNDKPYCSQDCVDMDQDEEEEEIEDEEEEEKK